MFRNLRSGLSKVVSKISKKKLRAEEIEDFFSDLQLILLENDVAYEVTEYIEIELKKSLENIEVSRFDDISILIKRTLYQILNNMLSAVDSIDFISYLKQHSKKPFSVIFLGVNGVGKTTTIAKMTYLLKKNKFKVVLACADTFRAGAIEQLKIHAKKIGVPMIFQRYGADPAAVAFDAVEHARTKGFDVVFIDTAGRQHSNVNLMEELKKISRVVEPDFKILIVDALSGNDAYNQAVEFNDKIGVDGVVFTKVDADAKGGAIISVVSATKKPVLYLGVGQSYDDLKRFDKEKFLNQILGG